MKLSASEIKALKFWHSLAPLPAETTFPHPNTTRSLCKKQLLEYATDWPGLDLTPKGLETLQKLGIS